MRTQQQIEHQIGEIQLTGRLQRQQAITIQGVDRAWFHGNDVFQKILQVLRIELPNGKLEFIVVPIISTISKCCVLENGMKAEKTVALTIIPA